MHHPAAQLSKSPFNHHPELKHLKLQLQLYRLLLLLKLPLFSLLLRCQSRLSLTTVQHHQSFTPC
jgi:hypothetical protein